MTYEAANRGHTAEAGGLQGHRLRALAIASVILSVIGGPGVAMAEPPGEVTSLPHYYGHDALEDQYGVIAPWYRGQNGQLDFRVRVAAETLKRYPWVTPPKAPSAAPHFVYNGAWRIGEDGTIAIPEITDWSNGDLGQRAAYVLSGLVDYYRYSGDASAIGLMSVTAECVLDHCQTGPDHPWPQFFISVPNRGEPYGEADPHGFIQLDIAAEVGIALLRAYQVVGRERWLNATVRWGELLAQKRDRTPGAPPWGRYANPEDVNWEDIQTGGVVFILRLFDELIRLGERGRDNCIVDARNAGREYLHDVLLPRWTVDDTWGRNYWDWPDPVQAENVTEYAVRHMMERPGQFPNWRNDCRNIMSLFLNRTSVSAGSRGDVYSGAWAYPESSGCCGRSLWYGPMELATVYAEYGVLADSEWAREMARRQIILATYATHETGVVEDNIDGGPIVAGSWFKIAHPMALKHVLGVMGWLPETFGALRENHIMRSGATVGNVVYGDGNVAYETFDAPGPCVDVLRLSFMPGAVTADGDKLGRAEELGSNGYSVEPLPAGDYIVSIRHDGRRHVAVRGDDPQSATDDDALDYTGHWEVAGDGADNGGSVHQTSSNGASMTFRFTGNQVRLIGRVGPEGGRADVSLDGEKQLVGIDCWCPHVRRRQVLYRRSGLAGGEHVLKITAQGAGNPLSEGTNVYVDGVQWSEATGEADYGSGGGPTGPQRVVFGYGAREDYVDSEGNEWRPATEFVARLGHLADVVEECWWQRRRQHDIGKTEDAELYRYGVHAPEFTSYFTVGPGTYHVRLRFAETRVAEPRTRAVTIAMNGRKVVEGLDIEATAGGYREAVDLVFNDVKPVHGVIAIHLAGTYGGEAMLQAAEVGPGPGGQGAEPICLPPAEKRAGNVLVNPGFEDGVATELGRLGKTGGGVGWRYVFASPSQCYIWAESAYSIHPDWGLPNIHTGDEAIRTHSDGDGQTIIYQDVTVASGTEYRASVMVNAVDVTGEGFGKSPTDSAGLWIQELDRGGKVVADHGKIALTTAGDYRKPATTFTTTDETVNVRFLLDTIIGCAYDQGHVTYDDCELMPLD